MSHSGAALSAMKVMIVVMVMALLTTTSHCININSSIVSGGSYSSSSSRCNGLTATACRIAFSELNFDLEFMLDSEFSIRLLADGKKIVYDALAKEPVSCGSPDVDKSARCLAEAHKNPPGCNNEPTNRECHRHDNK